MDRIKPYTTTAAVTFVAVAAFFLPGLAELLELRVDTLAVRDFWRLLTGHAAHWNGNHLFWDVIIFAILGGWVERQLGSRTFAAYLVIQAVVISATALLTLPEHLVTYRGLSGLDSALFVTAALLLTRRLTGIRRSLPAALLVLFIGKSLWEISTGSPLFVTDITFEPVPMAHLAGAAAAFLIAGMSLLIRRMRKASPIHPINNSLPPAGSTLRGDP